MAKKDFSGVVGVAVKQQQLSEDAIKKNLIILPELKDFIPPLTKDEFLQLEDNIKSEGCRDPLVIWKQDDKYILVDGHNRYKICNENKIDYKIEVKKFEDMDAVKDWMIANQLGKRNMTEEQKSYFRGKQYEMEKIKEGFKGNQHLKSGGGQNDHKQKTNEKLADMHKVSPKTIQRDEKYAKGIDKIMAMDTGLKWEILNRNISVPKNLIEELAEADTDTLKSFISKIKTQSWDSIKNIPNKANPSSNKNTPSKATTETDEYTLAHKQLLQDLKLLENKRDKNSYNQAKKSLQALEKFIQK
jgi:ParB-like nuclease domain